MAFLKQTIFLVLLPACYSPEIRDCTTACSKADDCAPNQVCGNDGFCASANSAGTCGSIAAGDASVDSSDKPMKDAPPPADAPPAPTVKLRVLVDGRGVVSIPTVGECDGGSGSMECVYDVYKDVPLTLEATPKNNWRFDRWEDSCGGQPTSACVITPSMDSQVRARFDLIDDD